jgi:hypothetical protein
MKDASIQIELYKREAACEKTASKTLTKKQRCYTTSYLVTLCSTRRASFGLTKVPVFPAEIFVAIIRTMTSFTLT